MPDMEVEESVRFESIWRKSETAIVAITAVLLVCAAIGLLGDGPAGKRTVAVPELGAAVSYEALVRNRLANTMHIDVMAPLGSDVLQVALDMDMLRYVTISQTQPLPAAAASSPKALIYTFRLGPGRAGRISIQFTPKRSGLMHGTVTLGGVPVPVRQLIYP